MTKEPQMNPRTEIAMSDADKVADLMSRAAVIGQISTREFRDMGQLHNHAVELAVAAFNKGDESPPTWIMDTGYAGAIMTTLWASNEEKMIYLDVVRGMAKAVNSVRLAFFSEVWMAKYKTFEPEVDPLPRNHPAKQSAIMILTQDKYGSYLQSILPIERSEGWKRKLGERMDSTGDGKSGGGNMVGMLLP